uniref:Uncharacterized protein n=1 Tax=Timspurckia oligopyrenoides TaxID=708627 RepID=A0A7S0ZGP4_9RHOD
MGEELMEQSEETKAARILESKKQARVLRFEIFGVDGNTLIQGCLVLILAFLLLVLVLTISSVQQLESFYFSLRSQSRGTFSATSTRSFRSY